MMASARRAAFGTLPRVNLLPFFRLLRATFRRWAVADGCGSSLFDPVQMGAATWLNRIRKFQLSSEC